VVWIGFIWLRIWTSGGLLYEHGKEPESSIKCWEVLEKLCDWRILKKASAPWS
jgi:hypothetical protein